ncbi:hypothetical protein B7Z17_02395 [Candidatus Saccharibacteria bacterium 32-49-10]|nr:MAG: hypothetical protein B7Z17_02395 [Candidatus Saccharibacteria bacterium 32-49-10]
MGVTSSEFYSHRPLIPTVEVGKTVAEGDVIGVVGQTQLHRPSMAKHVHASILTDLSEIAAERDLTL